LVLLAAVSKPEGSLSAVVVSGGKQYRVAPGDQILVDRLAAEPGSSVKLGRVLMVHDGDDFKIGKPGVEGVDVEAKVLAHRRGPRIEILRYKSKKHVRVHRGARADLTAIEILTVGGKGAEIAETKKTKTEKSKAKPKAAAAEAKAAVAEPEAKSKPASAAEPKAATEAKTKAKPKAEKAPKESE